MTFSEMLQQLFAPAFKFVGDSFSSLLDEIGFKEIFLGVIVLGVAFRLLIMPIVGSSFGTISSAAAGLRERRRAEQRKQERQSRSSKED